MEFGELEQFFSQMPPELIMNICLMTLLLAGLLIYFAYIKPMRQKRKQSAQADFSTPAVAPPAYQPFTPQSAPQTAPQPVAPIVPPAPKPAPVVKSDNVPADGIYPVRLHDGHPTRAKEMLSILRDTHDDRLLIEIDGSGYRSLTEHPEVKAKFTALMRELAETIAKPDTPRPVVPVESVPVPASTIDDLLDRDLDALDDLDEMPDLDSLSTLPSEDFAAPLPPLPKVSFNAAPPPVKPTKADAPPPPVLTLAEQIEAYLQQKRVMHPHYAARAIHVHAATHGGVVIQVDDTYFESVDEISDPQIRAFIAQTIEEWQAQQ